MHAVVNIFNFPFLNSTICLLKSLYLVFTKLAAVVDFDEKNVVDSQAHIFFSCIGD